MVECGRIIIISRKVVINCGQFRLPERKCEISAIQVYFMRISWLYSLLTLQDMPLSNELRPPEVLARTMTFILNNIIQLGGERKWSDWFEYIWSRTRSIRKVTITSRQSKSWKIILL